MQAGGSDRQRHERDRASEKHRRIAEAFFLSAYKAQMRGRLGQALRLYRQSVAAYPTAEAHTFVGWTLSLLSRYEEAIEACKRAIEVDPNLGNPYNDIGAYLLELDRPAEAIQWLRKALAAPRYDSCHFAYYNMGRACEALFDPIEAESCYRKALELNPSYLLAREAARILEARRN